MLSMGPGFTRLEQSVLNAICEMYPKDRAALEAQLASATLLRRENTGAGFYTYFAMEPPPDTAIQGKRIRPGPTAKVGGLQYGMGFILWLKEGCVECLEGYSHDESTRGFDFEQLWFELVQD
jgi:hypothetical protein